MNISEKHPNGPVLPITHDYPHDTTATTAPTSRTDRFFLAMETFSRKLERLNRTLESIAMFVMILVQSLCLGVVFVYTALLAYLFATGRRASSPELALEVVCYIGPFLVLGAAVRFIELISLSVRMLEVHTARVPAN
ncbi:hypothetical protein V493_01318 [Pseudogymnoascus sp. VKM F-4281 (FW-2241)]|nr:hypothetical protein V493_01318 [Pseudogymnoascus sp. VKM F-4281 (FW-2241)]